jgi:hypothetical protein
VTLRLVEARNVLQHLHRLVVLASVEQELWAFLESKEEHSCEEDGECDGSQREEQVAPPRIRIACAACVACSNVIARWQRVALREVGRATVEGNKAVGNRAANHNADGLKNGQHREEEAAVLNQASSASAHTLRMEVGGCEPLG